jgi:GT2 family glycosyltransferase
VLSESDLTVILKCRDLLSAEQQDCGKAVQGCTVRSSILVVSFNTKDLTRACLKSVQRWEPASEVIVIDNASHDGSADMVADEFPDVRLIRLSHNIGFGRANSLAMRFSQHDVIVLLNSDTVLPNNALSRCAEYLMSDETLGAVTPRLTGVDGVEQNSRHAVPLFRATLKRSLWGCSMTSEGGEFWIPGTCMLLKRSAVEAAGGLFEPALFIYWEDADLCSRLRKCGYRLDVVNDVQIIHYGGASGGGPNCTAKSGLHEWYTFGRHFWFARHRPRWESVGLWLLEFVDAFRCMGRSILRPSRRHEWPFGKTLLKTLVRRLFGLCPSFAQSDVRGRTDEQLIVAPPKPIRPNRMDVHVTEIGMVVIGRNEGERLKRCLKSLLRTNAPVVYVDSGSTDGSQHFAQEAGATLVELNLSQMFTAARARNAGLETLMRKYPHLKYVQFVDGDCEMTDGWFAAAKHTIESDSYCAVVCGSLQERFPDASTYNRLCQLEWRRSVGTLESCGGIFLGRIAALNEAGQFNAKLIAGEEPELCVRLRHAGWNIRGIADVMAKHDAAMSRFGQWWKRSVRAGHSYAQGFAMHGRTTERFRQRELRSILVWGLIAPMAALALAWPTYGISLLILAAGYLRLYNKIRWSRIQHGDSADDAAIYARFVVLGKIPQVQGVLKFAFNGVRGRSSGIIEYK